MSFRKPAPGCTPYQYEPLPNGSIRLVTLFPGKMGTPLAATLKIVPLAAGDQPRQLKIPYYEALSYTWGTPFIEDHLYIDQKNYLSIGANLSAALRRLRHTDRPRTLWVDALSIDQKDPIERAHQVSIMKDVYSGADKVIIFIGLEGHRSDEAMACVADVDDDVTAQNSQAVNSLLRRPWFSRVWVVQEVARSRSAVVVCGSKAVSWDCFWRLPFRCRQSGWSDFSSTDGLPGILNYSSGHPPVSGSEGLLHLLHENRGAGATDLRDKIFGILGLMDNASPYLKLIDYTSPVDSVYSLVAHQVIQDSGSLQILSAAGHGYLDVFNRSIHGLGVPSWVPDWSIVRPVASLTLGKTFVEPFEAGGRQSCIRIKYQSWKPSILSAMGTTIGSVQEVSEKARIGYVPSELERQKVEMSILQKWFDVALRANASDEAFLDTISASPRSAVSAPTETMLPTPWPQPWEDGDTSWRRWYSSPLSRRVSNVIRYRRLFICSKDSVGLGPENMQKGDLIVALLGGPVPYVLRPIPHKNDIPRFELIGECYVHGVMHGEAFHHVRRKAEELGGILPPTSSGPCTEQLRWFSIQ